MLVNLDCPVEMIDYELFESKTNDQIYCALTFNNLSEKLVKGLKVLIHCYDQFGDPVGKENNSLECKIEFKEGLATNCISPADKKIILRNFRDTRKIEVDILKVLFDDKFLWSVDISKSEKYELTKIKKPNLLEFVQSREGVDARNFSMEIGERWICVCGRLNHKEQSECKRCRRIKDYVLAEYSSEEIIEHNFKVYSKQMEEENKKEQEKESQQLALKKKKIKKAIMLFSCVAVVLLVIGFVWGLVSKFTFSLGEQVPIERKNNTAQLPESEPDGVIDTSFESYGVSSGNGRFTIEYRKDGQIKSKVIMNVNQPQLIDIDNNGTKEIVITYPIYLSNLSYLLNTSWDDVYDFDMTKEDLVLASWKYTDYYKNTYIPSLRKKSARISNYSEKQVITAIIQAATDLTKGKFIPDANQKQITQMVEAKSMENPLHITKQGDAFYIHGITLGMSINEAIKILGKPDESFEVNSKVAKWYLDNHLILTAEYSTDTFHYIDLGEFNEKILDQSIGAFGVPVMQDENEYSYITSTQELRFHDMPGPHSFRVQLMDPEVP